MYCERGGPPIFHHRSAIHKRKMVFSKLNLHINWRHLSIFFPRWWILTKHSAYIPSNQYIFGILHIPFTCNKTHVYVSTSYMRDKDFFLIVFCTLSIYNIIYIIIYIYIIIISITHKFWIVIKNTRNTKRTSDLYSK